MTSLIDFLILKHRKRYFDKVFYSSTYQDVAFSALDPWEHYCNIGYYQERRFCPGPKGYTIPAYTRKNIIRLLRHRFMFDAAFYAEDNKEELMATGLTPWQHYCLFGLQEKRSYSRRQAERRERRREAREAKEEAVLQKQEEQAEQAEPNNPAPAKVVFKGQYKSHPVWQTLKAYADRLLHRRVPQARIAVILHLFYMNSWAEIYSYIRMLKRYGADFYITYPEDFADNKVLAQVRRNLPNVKLIPCPNQGFDVGPFLEVLRTISLDDYDIVYKLQSKGTKRRNLYMYRQIFKKRDWFLNLYRGLFGFNRTAEVIRLLTEKDNGIGLVAAENLIICDPPHKSAFTLQQAKERFGLEVPPDYHFVAGTCFAVRAALLKPIKDWGLSLNDFATTQRGKFSLAHALERLVCAITELQGYRQHGLPTPRNRYARELHRRQACDSVRLLKDPRFTLDNDFFYKTLERRMIPYYEVVSLRLGDIRRKWFDGKIYNLSECSPFRYLNGDKEAYARYCEENAAYSKFDMSQERYDELIHSLDNGYDSKHMPVVRADNVIMDGQHRSCILLHRFGPDHKIDVLRIYSRLP